MVSERYLKYKETYKIMKMIEMKLHNLGITGLKNNRWYKWKMY